MSIEHLYRTRHRIPITTIMYGYAHIPQETTKRLQESSIHLVYTESISLGYFGL